LHKTLPHFVEACEFQHLTSGEVSRACVESSEPSKFIPLAAGVQDISAHSAPGTITRVGKIAVTLMIRHHPLQLLAAHPLAHRSPPFAERAAACDFTITGHTLHAYFFLLNFHVPRIPSSAHAIHARRVRSTQQM
jgi:hypothetical protein